MKVSYATINIELGFEVDVPTEILSAYTKKMLDMIIHDTGKIIAIDDPRLRETPIRVKASGHAVYGRKDK